MAARIEPASRVSHLQLVDLRRLASLQLDALLDDEVRIWREELDWDFTKSAELVRRFVDLRALSGCALMDGSSAVGYCLRSGGTKRVSAICICAGISTRRMRTCCWGPRSTA
jgi:hypothetical protein